jgi:hypothetical protein
MPHQNENSLHLIPVLHGTSRAAASCVIRSRPQIILSGTTARLAGGARIDTALVAELFKFGWEAGTMLLQAELGKFGH